MSETRGSPESDRELRALEGNLSISVLILGMHRSGTSATAGTLQLAGVDLGKNLTPPRDENPRGFFEHDEIWKLHDRLLAKLGSSAIDVHALSRGWAESEVATQIADELFEMLNQDFACSPLWGVKDPRLSRTFPVWPGVLKRLGADPRVVLTLRHPIESARSLERRDGCDVAQGLKLWLRYTLDAENATRGSRRVVLHYPDLLSDWRSSLTRIEQTLALGIVGCLTDRAQEIRSFLDPSLRHQRVEQDWTHTNCPQLLAAWCEAVYQAMLRLPNNDAIATIDRVAAEFDLELHHQYLALLNERDQFKADSRKLRVDVALLEAEVAGARSEAEEARALLHGILGSRTWRAMAPLRAAVETWKSLTRIAR